MKKELVQRLHIEAKEAGKYLSIEKENYPNYKFEVDEIIPLSEMTAIVVFSKKDNPKKALAFFYFTEHWRYFLPKESHVFGMGKVWQYLQKIEENNFKFNEEVK